MVKGLGSRVRHLWQRYVLLREILTSAKTSVVLYRLFYSAAPEAGACSPWTEWCRVFFFPVPLAVIRDLSGSTCVSMNGVSECIRQPEPWQGQPMGYIVVPLCRLYLGSYKVIPKRNYYGAYG